MKLVQQYIQYSQKQAAQMDAELKFVTDHTCFSQSFDYMR